MIMVTLARQLERRASRIPFAPVVALMFGTAAAVLVAAVPVAMFERAVMASGLPALVDIAAPPLGLKARILGVALAFFVVTAGLWLALIPVSRWLDRDRRRRTPWRDTDFIDEVEPMPSVDTRRRPIFAPAELGAPLMSDEAIAKPLVDLQPDFEPLELPTVDLPPLEPAAELEVPLRAVEFDLPPVVVAQDDDDTIYGLIRRLESGLARRAANDPGPDAPGSAPLPRASAWLIDKGNDSDEGEAQNTDDLRQALGELRRLATR